MNEPPPTPRLWEWSYAAARPLAVIASVLALLSWWAYWPPFTWLALLQDAVLGHYYPVPTLVATYLLFMVAVFALAHGWRTMGVAPPPDVITPLVQRHGIGPTAAVVAGVAALCFGAYDAIEAYSLGDHRETIALSELADGHTPSTRWVQITDYHADPLEVLTVAHGSSGDHCYLPLYASLDAPPLVIVVFDSVVGADVTSGPIAGVLRRGGLPADVRAAFEDAGLERGSYWVLALDDSPSRIASVGRLLLTIGVGLFLGGMGAARRRLGSPSR